MFENDEVAEQIRKNRESALAAERAETAPKVSMLQVKVAAVVAFAGAALFDISSAWIIFSITGYWPYGLGWILGGGGGLVFSEWLKSRIGNNFQQRRISEASRNVSAIAIVGMSLVSGVIYVLKIQSQVMEVVFVVSVVSLFFFHLVQAFRYREVDDDYIKRNAEARRAESHKARMQEIEDARHEVELARLQTEKKKEYTAKYGEAFTAAYGKDVNAVGLKEPSSRPTSGQPEQ